MIINIINKETIFGSYVDCPIKSAKIQNVRPSLEPPIILQYNISKIYITVTRHGTHDSVTFVSSSALTSKPLEFVLYYIGLVACHNTL